MKTIKIRDYSELPTDFTGIAEYPNGKKEWYLNGKRHRTDGSAWEGADGSKLWCLNGKLHREYGPAIEGADGTKVWWVNGNFIYALEPIGDYILIEDGLPSEVEWLGKRVAQRKVLTGKGFMYIPNLPGME
jgi:hypothetical protein